MMLALLLPLAITAVAPQQISVGEARRTTPAALAARLLPAEIARRIVGGKVSRRWLPGQVYRAAFWEAGEPAGRLICRRRFHGLDLSNPAAPGHPEDPSVGLNAGEISSWLGYRTTYKQPATRASCASDEGWITPSPQAAAATLVALDQLTGAMRTASRSKRLPFTISCQEEEGGKACRNRQAALANLPLGALFNVSFDTGHYVTASDEPAPSGAGRIRVLKMAPSPDGKPPIPTFEFGASAPDGKSWRVTLIGAPGRVAEVRMRRSTIIYH